ncbi:hypothetical protein [Nostoc sp. CHAB 5715]|nr:hypothetical protein [Nostoc sp. CHAB 5715]MCC5620372.1 hypothetical protein [Nostoc sp. CHAB 5715]
MGNGEWGIGHGAWSKRNRGEKFSVCSLASLIMPNAQCPSRVLSVQ